jgi:hypothetical protein
MPVWLRWGLLVGLFLVLLQLLILLLQPPHTPHVAHLHATILGLPSVQSPWRYSVAPAYFPRFYSGLGFLQHPDNLLLAKPASPHG